MSIKKIRGLQCTQNRENLMVKDMRVHEDQHFCTVGGSNTLQEFHKFCRQFKQIDNPNKFSGFSIE